jgi:hypothetical protein
MESLLKSLVVTSAALLLVGCGVPVPNVPEGETVAYGQHLEPLVLAHCLGCHTAEEPKAKLVLEVGSGYANLVNRQSEQVPDMALVESGDPEASYLWLKLQHQTETGKGMPRTPTGSKKLRQAELDLYERWIEEGALP